MLRVWILGLWMGCTCAGEDPNSRDLTVPRMAPAMPPPLGSPDVPARQPAPSRELWGLSLGRMDEAGLKAWVASHGLTCEAEDAARRMTTQVRCKVSDLPQIISARSPGEVETMLLLARPDSGALHHVSTLRKHASAKDALVDFAAASDAIVSGWGAPTQAAPRAPTVDDLSGPHLRVVSRWDFSDLTVELSLSKVGGAHIVVRERWDVPGVEAGVPPRPGSVGHAVGAGQSPHSPHGIVSED